MVDFQLGKEIINNLPTLFILAGIHGNEITGTVSLYHFFNNFLINDHYDVKQILKHCRLVILPTSNV